LFNQSSQCVGFGVGGDECPNLSLALYHAHYRSLVFIAAHWTARAAPLAPTADVGFVHFNPAIESANRPALFIGKYGANLLKHAPSGFVGHSRLALNLFRGDTTAGSRHEVHGVEPC